MSEYQTQMRSVLISSRRSLASERKSLGTIHDQKFYAIRNTGEKPLELPFSTKPFNVMIELALPLSDDALRQIGIQLLKDGMCHATCRGGEAERMGEILDDLIDEHGFSIDGHTVFTSVHDDESLEEVLEYFVLPNGLASTSLLVVIGDEASFHNLVRCFGSTAADLRERIFVETA